MRLELTNFRCHLHQTYYFPEDQISLLKGEPGNGKTTVFNAIWWVLYGNLRGVGHHLSNSNRTSVIIQFERLPSLGTGITIQRQNHPNKFELTIEQTISNEKNVHHEGDIAQQLVNQVFGSRETWKAVSYIIQGEQCLLLSGSKQDRLKLLEELSFHQDNPKEAIEKIDQQLKIERQKFQVMEGTFQRECQRLSQELANCVIPENCTSEAISEIETKLKQDREEFIKEQSKENERSRLNGLSTHLRREMESIKNNPCLNLTENEIENKSKSYQDILIDLDHKMESIQREIAQYEATDGRENYQIEEKLKFARNEQELHSNKLNQIKNELKVLQDRFNQIQINLESSNSSLISIEKYLQELAVWIEKEETRLAPLPVRHGWQNDASTPQNSWPTLLQLGEITQIEKDRQINYQRAVDFQIEYSPSIQSVLNQMESELQALEKQNLQSTLINRVISLRSQSRQLLTNLTMKANSKLETVAEVQEMQSILRQMLPDKTAHLKEMESAVALLSCPKCGQSLSVKDGNLTSDPRKPPSPGSIEKLKDEIAKISQLDKQLSALLTSWEGINQREISASDDLINLESMEKNIQDLKMKIHKMRQIRWIPPPIMDSQRCRDLITLKSKYEERDLMTDKMKSFNSEIEQNRTLLNNLQTEINQKDEQVKQYQENTWLPIKNKVASLEQEQAELAQKLSNSPLDRMKREVETLKTTRRQTELDKQQLEKMVHERNYLLNQSKSKEAEIAALQESVEKLGPSLLNQISNQIDIGKQKLVDLQQGVRLIKWQQDLTLERDELVEQQKSLASLEELRKLAEKVEYTRLVDTIKSINLTMNQVFSALFDDEIMVELELFKKLKTKDRTKPQVNCLIHYKGSTYDQPSSISGGEKNRLNLGMILALNLVSFSPLILLDECTCFLNNRLRIKCIDTIRNIIGNCKTIICVSHGDNEASYDNIIEVVSTADHLPPKSYLI